MNDPITDLMQATPNWITGILRKRGCLSNGRVISVRKRSWTTITSIVSHLKLDYSAGTSASPPMRLFLKISRPEARLGGGKGEVEFYTKIANAMDDPPSPRCFDAAYSPETGQYHVLLEDVTHTHFRAGPSLLASERLCGPVIDCLGRFHAFWWEHPRLGKDVGEVPTHKSLGDYVSEIERILPGFLGQAGDRLQVDVRTLLRQAFSSLPGLWKRLGEGKGITLTHGDAHLANFLYPHNPRKDSVRMIDWQFCNVGLGANDLAFMIAPHWAPNRRRSLSGRFIRRYHRELVKRGVENYSWDDCWYDYRVSVIDNLYLPVWQWKARMPLDIWWPNLKRVVRAFKDLRCAELLQS